MPRPLQTIADGLAHHAIAGPIIRDDERRLTALHSIKADHPLRAGQAARAGDILKGS
jgi:hypothetical protein